MARGEGRELRVGVRAAAPRDREAMLRITRDVWEGTDYLPYVWDRWVSEPHGYLCVATVAGEVVGVQHIDVQPDATAWLEGIRVDARMQGRGIGRALLEHGLGWARDVGCQVARLSTSTGNGASNRIAGLGGFETVARFHALTAPAAGELISRSLTVRLAHPGERHALIGFLERAEHHDAAPGLYTEGWTAYRLTSERLALLLGIHAVVVAGQAQGDVEALGVATASLLRPSLRIGLLRGTVAGITAIASWTQGAAANAGLETVRATVAIDEQAVDGLGSLGFRSVEGRGMLLWERAL